MEISDPDWRWGNMCAVLYIVDNKGMGFSSILWVDYTRLTSGRITCSPCVILNDMLVWGLVVVR